MITVFFIIFFQKVCEQNKNIENLKNWKESGASSGETNTIEFTFSPEFEYGVYEFIMVQYTDNSPRAYFIVVYNSDGIEIITKDDIFVYSTNGNMLKIDDTGYYRKLIYKKKY